MCRRVSFYTAKGFRFPSTQTWQPLSAPIMACPSLTAFKNDHVRCGSVDTLHLSTRLYLPYLRLFCVALCESMWALSSKLLPLPFCSFRFGAGLGTCCLVLLRSVTVSLRWGTWHFFLIYPSSLCCGKCFPLLPGHLLIEGLVSL